MVSAADVPEGGSRRARASAFHHEALVYSGDGGFLEGTLPFIRAAVERGEQVLVTVDGRKIALLRDQLGGVGEQVTYADMAEIGRNPSRLIAFWGDFAGSNLLQGRRVSGIGEPVWPGRSAAELVECLHHESLLNLAFASGTPLRLLCPYDADVLGEEILEETLRSHPLWTRDGEQRTSTTYAPPAPAPPNAPLGTPVEAVDTFRFEGLELREVRAFASDRGRAAGMDKSRVGDLELAVTELATNSVTHGGGGGTLEVWRDADALLCEVRDRGRIFDPLVGRRRPALTQPHGRGLWITNQLCDLVQIRSGKQGTQVRIRMATAPA